MFGGDTFLEFSKAFSYWYDTNTSNTAVGNVVVHYHNRAQDKIARYDFWDYLMVTTTLTITDKEAALPSDFYKDWAVFIDNDGDGRPDEFLYLAGPVSRGYYINGGYTPTDGYSNKKFVFFDQPGGTVKLMYQKLLADFGDDDENLNSKKLAFPLELMLVTAKMLAAIDFGPINDQFGVFKAMYEEEMRDFKDAHQHNNGWAEFVMTDRYGNQVFNPRYDLLGSRYNDTNRGRSNSYLDS